MNIVYEFQSLIRAIGIDKPVALCYTISAEA